MRPRWPLATAIVHLILGLALTNEGAGQSLDVQKRSEPPEPTVKHSRSAIAITADGAMLLAVNLDSNSISLIDPAYQLLLAEIPVGVDPRTVSVDDGGHLAFVANRGSDTISVVDLAGRRFLSQIPVGAWS